MIVLPSEKCSLKLPQATVEYLPNFLTQEDAQSLFNYLLKEVPWQQDNIQVFGKWYKQPRLTALYGKNENPYSYSGIKMTPLKFTDELEELNKQVENQCKHKFTTVLLNRYRNGQDSNGWHADNEKELGKNPIIASLSLGASRYFYFKHRTQKNHNYKLKLESGSLLIMGGKMQHYWLHQLAKTKQEIGERINLTFRYIK